nr:alpha/beta fold hydrolase [Pseudomonas sp. R5(2019)]
MVLNSGQPIKIRLICFPYAGGDPEQFRSWSADLSDHIELVTVRLPGHGSRLDETPYDEWAPLLEDTFAQLSGYLKEPHALFGHSFGGRLAYEIAKLTERRYVGQTRHLFVSGCRSPDSDQARPFLHELPQPDFDHALLSRGIAPPEAVRNSERRLQFEPAIRSDLKLAELWSDQIGESLNIPVTALYGSDDPLDSVASMMNWREFTRREFELIEVRGDHFFVTTQRKRLLQIINTHLGLLSE